MYWKYIKYLIDYHFFFFFFLFFFTATPFQGHRVVHEAGPCVFSSQEIKAMAEKAVATVKKKINKLM